MSTTEQLVLIGVIVEMVLIQHINGIFHLHEEKKILNATRFEELRK